MSFCCLLGGFVFYYKFGTIYYCLVFVLCLKNESTFFFLLWIKCWDGWRSFQYGLVKYLLFLLFSVQDFWPLFFPYCHNVEFSMCLPFHLYARSKQRLFQFQVIKINWTFDLISKSCLSCFFEIEGWEGEKREEWGVEASVQMIGLMLYFLSVLMGVSQERILIWGGHMNTCVMLSRCSSFAYIP